MRTDPKLIQLYQQISELTAPVCATECRLPWSCCSPEYCSMAIAKAEAEGIKLESTGHPTLPLMSPTGCIAAPYLRPLCTLHVCSINAFGFRPNQPKWTARYFELREQIEVLDGEPVATALAEELLHAELIREDAAAETDEASSEIDVY